MAHVVSVNTARPRSVPLVDGREMVSAIGRRPRTGPVAVRTLGLDDDEVADKRDHGGEWQAVYAFAVEDLDDWAERLGTALGPGMFGENLTTGGIDVNEALVGERWRVGTALLEVVDVRIPCITFADWLDANGIDATQWVKRFTREGRPGPYLRVLEQGVVTVGDPVVVEHRPDHGVTVATLFRAVTTERSLLADVLAVEDLRPEIAAAAQRWVAAHGATARPPVS